MQGRKAYLDYIKILGALFIVALHTISTTFSAYIGPTPMQVQVKHIIHQYLYVAVPMFVMATGAGFLSNPKKCTYAEMKNSILKIVICIVLYGVFFTGIKLLVNGEKLTFASIITRVIGGTTWAHMWYLYCLLGLYLCMPLLATFAKYTKDRDQLIFAGILLFFNSVYPYVGGWLGYYPAKTLPMESIWLFYAILGGILGRLSQEKLQKCLIYAVALVIIGLAASYYSAGRWCVLNEDTPELVALAVGLFLLLEILCKGRDTKRVSSAMAKNSLGVYILHPVLLQIAVRLLHINPWDGLPILALPALILFIFIMTNIGVYFARKIPIIGKWIL